MTYDIAKLYRTVSTQGTRPIEVVAMACERVAKDLYDAVHDIEIRDITAKTEHLNHALTLIGYMESVVDRADLGEEGVRIRLFHNMSRVHILFGSAHLSARVLNQVAGQFIEMGKTWSELQAKLDSESERRALPFESSESYIPPVSAESRQPSAWSA
jgi:flagellin-specific chaperone FliS